MLVTYVLWYTKYFNGRVAFCIQRGRAVIFLKHELGAIRQGREAIETPFPLGAAAGEAIFPCRTQVPEA